MNRVDHRDHIRALTGRVTQKWLLTIRDTNPAILSMFRDRDLKPARDLLPWSGEFAGKYLTGSAMTWNITRDDALKAYAEDFITELLTYQDEDGYLGAYDHAHRLTGKQAFSPDPFGGKPVVEGDTWDTWNHYHIMIGLMLWSDILHRADIDRAVEKIAALLMRTFYGADGRRMVDIGWPEMNLAPYHAMALLYNRTKEKKYLDMALKIERDTEDERAGQYMRFATENTAYWQCQKPRWESMHIIMGYAEMYRATGEAKYLNALRQITRSILETDVHNTGAFTTNEQAIGTPYRYGAIETCCVIAYNAVVRHLLRLEPDIALADHLEKSLYNAVAGYFADSGAWCTYDTPMDGCRRAASDSIAFQNRSGSPTLNCCSANAPRGLAELGEWAAFDLDGETYIHYFGRGEYETDGMRYAVEGDYPFSDTVTLRFERAGRIALRVPAWSKRSSVGEAGQYYRAEVKAGDALRVKFDFDYRLEYGRDDVAGKACVYRGPLLLGADQADNRALDFDALPPIAPGAFEGAEARTDGETIEVRLKNGLLLRDFRSLGQDGAAYRTWLPW